MITEKDIEQQIKKEKAFLRGLNQETEHDVSPNDLYPLVNKLALIEKASNWGQGLLKQTKNDLNKLHIIRQICSGEFCLLETHRLGEQINELIDPLILKFEEGPQVFEKVTESMPLHERKRRRFMIASVAREIKEILKERGCKDPVFWTALVIFGFAEFPLNMQGLTRLLRNQSRHHLRRCLLVS